MRCKYCDAQLTDELNKCHVCGNMTAKGEGQVRGAELYADLPNLPMRWFAFLINFLLFAFALIIAVYGTALVMGETYNTFGSVHSEIIYEENPYMQYLDIVIGCGMLACSLLYLVARFRLAGFCKGSPHLMCFTLVLTSALSVLRLAGMYVILPEELFVTMNVTYTIGTFAFFVIYVLLNTAYFKKRMPYFTR